MYRHFVFNSAQAMRIVNTDYADNKTVTTYYFDSNESKNKYANQTIEGNLIIEKDVRVSEYTFTSAIIKGDVIINEGVCLDR